MAATIAQLVDGTRKTPETSHSVEFLSDGTCIFKRGTNAPGAGPSSVDGRVHMQVVGMMWGGDWLGSFEGEQLIF